MLSNHSNHSNNEKQLPISEMYYSVQGEGYYSGYPCLFIRTVGCNLRCQWCDSEFSFFGGKKTSFEEIFLFTQQYPQALVEVTGGEPLLHKNTFLLLDELVAQKRKVLLETSGSISIEKVNKNVHLVLDLKAPASDECEKNLYKNIDYLKPNDDVKIIIAAEQDFIWVEQIMEEYPTLKKLNNPPILQVAYGIYSNDVLAEKIKSAKNSYRLGIQLHKYIYEPNARGV